MTLSLSTIRPELCLSAVGNAVSSVADAYGYVSVEKYRGNGIDWWTVVTESGGRSSQFEHTVAVMEDGIEILTELPE